MQPKRVINSMKVKVIAEDLLKLMDKVDDLEQKIINLNTRFHWLARDFKELKNKESKHEI